LLHPVDDGDREWSEVKRSIDEIQNVISQNQVAANHLDIATRSMSVEMEGIIQSVKSLGETAPADASW
jgi:hypothetical protein